jgi:hypothetical protein
MYSLLGDELAAICCFENRRSCNNAMVGKSRMHYSTENNNFSARMAALPSGFQNSTIFKPRRFLEPEYWLISSIYASNIFPRNLRNVTLASIK